MDWLRRLFGITDVADRVAPVRYVWSASRGIAHTANCPYRPRNAPDLRSSTDLATVRAACYRACRHCLGILPTPTYQHPIDDSWTWLYAADSRIAHRPNCACVRFIRPENLRHCNDLAEIIQVCHHGCRRCHTTIDFPNEERGLILREPPTSADKAIIVLDNIPVTGENPRRLYENLGQPHENP